MSLLVRLARRFSFSLRTLLLAVTVIAAVLGYHAEWIRRRHAFLAQEAKRQASGRGIKTDWERQYAVNWWRAQQVTDRRPPGFLRFFGEEGVGELYLLIPQADIANVQRADPDGLISWVSEMSAKQPDYIRAKRLFPEAEIMPMQWVDLDCFYPVQVLDR